MRDEIRGMFKLLYDMGKEIQTQKWQGVETPQPMLEILHVVFQSKMANDKSIAADLIKPNLPWADLHFEERVGGVPSNPGNTFHLWPFWRGGHRNNDEFTHTYQQRLWTNHLEGIKYRYGNLGDVVELLKREPDTRQAFVPVWFPEDTGVTHGGRVPCTIGYHFIVRDNKLDVTYYLRSCDARRHFLDDLYLCNRLALWIRDQVDPSWRMGDMRVIITSFHIFQSDYYWLQKTINNVRNNA